MNLSSFVTPITLEVPQRLSAIRSWQGHVPFAFWCIEAVKPDLFVELGTHEGDSYCAFCQAVAHLPLPTHCVAVDTWRGDEQAGFYGDDVYARLSKYHEDQYGTFSRLLRTTFDEAVEQFADGSIDLLHIDGLHTYEVVRHDFETWKPKLSARGVVLMHDVDVREATFGVWRFWDELCEQYPHFTFLHSNGLGVLAVGEAAPEPIKALCALPELEVNEVRRVFSRLGTAASLSSLRDELMRESEALRSQLAERDGKVAEWEGRFAAREAERQAEHQAEKKALEDRLAQLYEEFDAYQKHFAEAIEGHNDYIRRLQRDLHAVHRSTSWRVTVPLRLAMAGVYGLASGLRRLVTRRAPGAAPPVG